MSQHRRARGVVATARWLLCGVCCLVLMFGCRRLFCFRWRFWFFIFLGSCCVTSSTLLFTSDFTHYRHTSFSRAIMTTLPPALKPPAPPPPALFLASGYPLPIQPSNPSAHTSHTSSTACACSPHALRMARQLQPGYLGSSLRTLSSLPFCKISRANTNWLSIR